MSSSAARRPTWTASEIICDGMWGIPWDRPVRRLNEYLDGLLPLLSGEEADAEGQTVTTRGRAGVPGHTGARGPS